ncbi:hypothetical protein [Mesobacillus subterraneus]|uniref:Uncharacterized protein n=1 Tax=Mesobacillus subterraneus TaxID=285983 RepID=A0A427TMB2_9BACI|nr:hypothetical protein [Mesobacillus subterraneus]RSD25494.1 hypothetical protein EJA10_16955 [Mesobacillus subterraneus]
MDNRKHESFDQRFLAPLKNRPGLEPDEIFVEKLRSELTNGSKTSIPLRQKWHWPILVPMAMAVLLFSVLSASFLGSDTSKESSENVKMADEEDKDKSDKKSEGRDIYNLIASNEGFKRVYQTVTKSTGSPTAGRELVFYFDALQKKDEKYIQDVLVFEYFENNVKEVLDYYHSADFSTLEIESVESSQHGRSLVTFNFLDNRKKDLIRKRLLVDLSDGKHIKVLDYIDPAEINFEKEAKVKVKAEYLDNNFRLGMTEKEAIQIFGSSYEEYTDSDAEDGTVKYWLYQLEADENTTSKVPNKSMVDFENLHNQKIGIQFWIGWSTDEKVMNMSMFYSLKGKIHSKILKSDGTILEDQQLTGEIILDTTPFKLDEEETIAYERFRKDPSAKHLKNIAPLSIARFYIQAQLDRDYHAQYALYTTQPERVMWSKEKHLEEALKYEESKEDILRVFEGFNEGEFVQINDTDGYVQFQNKNGLQGFSMTKDPDGVWKVNFMPMQ